MVNFYVLNYSGSNNTQIESCINSFLEHLAEKGIKGAFRIEHCSESLKNRFQKFIKDEATTLLDNDKFVTEVNCYLGEISNYINTQNYKFIFIGEQLKTKNPWGDANNWIAVITNLVEKVIWHEMAHLLGAEDHYDPNTYAATNICRNPSGCIMTFGNIDGEICTESIEEIRKYMKQS